MSSESEGSDDWTDEEKAVEKQIKNVKDADSNNVDKLNANLVSGDSIFNCPGRNSYRVCKILEQSYLR